MIISVTGHRLEKIVSSHKEAYSEELFLRLINFAKQELLILKPEMVITGVALGFDQSVSLAAIELNLPFVAAIPFDNQDRIWPQASKDLYRSIIEHKLCEKHVVSPGLFNPKKMQIRNQWMVDNADLVLALFNGSSGGTKNCIEYANKIGKPVINVWDKWEKYDKENHGK